MVQFQLSPSELNDRGAVNGEADGGIARTTKEDIGEDTGDTKNSTVVQDDDDDDDDVDELAKVRRSNGNDSQRGSIHRSDSFENFLARSARSLRIGKDKPPSPDEAARRGVKFIPDQEIISVVVVEPVSDDDKRNYWLTGEDFERFEKDIKVTQFRLDNHRNGKIAFDESNNTIRGLEHILDLGTAANQPDSTPQAKRYKHTQVVLQEIHSQKLSGGGRIDWEKVRQVSQSRSMEDLTKAQEMGKADERARLDAWGGNAMASVTDFVPSKGRSATPGTTRRARGGLKKSTSTPKKKPGFLSWIPGMK